MTVPEGGLLVLQVLVAIVKSDDVPLNPCELFLNLCELGHILPEVPGIGRLTAGVVVVLFSQAFQFDDLPFESFFPRAKRGKPGLQFLCLSRVVSDRSFAAFYAG